MTEEDFQLALLNAQIVGFTHGRRGYSLESLIYSAGVTLDEWERYLEEYALHSLSDEEKKDVTRYLKTEEEKHEPATID